MVDEAPPVEDVLREAIAFIDQSTVVAHSAVFDQRFLLRECRRARLLDTPGVVLHNVNQLLRELGQQDMLVTVFYAVVDRERRRLTYVRAGHEHPFLVRDGRVLPLGGRGMVLGLFDSPTFMAP